MIRYLLKMEPLTLHKGLEMIVVLEEDVRNFLYPTPFELHFSPSPYFRPLIAQALDAYARKADFPVTEQAVRLTAFADHMHRDIFASCKPCNT